MRTVSREVSLEHEDVEGHENASCLSRSFASFVFYLHADHPSGRASGRSLGSTSLATNDTGGFVSRVLYYPYGETRYAEGTLPTDRLYTGQRWEQGFGLYDYHARYYDPALGRFVSADTIAPEQGNPQSLNRYAYVLNNPLRYTDPSGHREWEGGDDLPPFRVGPPYLLFLGFEIPYERLPYSEEVRRADQWLWKSSTNVIGIAFPGVQVGGFFANGPGAELGYEATHVWNYRSGELSTINSIGAAVGGGGGPGGLFLDFSVAGFGARGARSNKVFEGGDWQLSMSGDVAHGGDIGGGLDISMQANDDLSAYIDPVSCVSVIGFAPKVSIGVGEGAKVSVTGSAPFMNTSHVTNRFSVQATVDLGRAVVGYGKATITTGRAIWRELGMEGKDLRH